VPLLGASGSPLLAASGLPLPAELRVPRARPAAERLLLPAGARRPARRGCRTRRRRAPWRSGDRRAADRASALSRRDALFVRLPFAASSHSDGRPLGTLAFANVALALEKGVIAVGLGGGGKVRGTLHGMALRCPSSFFRRASGDAHGAGKSTHSTRAPDVIARTGGCHRLGLHVACRSAGPSRHLNLSIGKYD
jgi:hypothetical protein